MTPYDLTHTATRAEELVKQGASHNVAIFYMLLALLRHEADKEADRNIERHHANAEGRDP